MNVRILLAKDVVHLDPGDGVLVAVSQAPGALANGTRVEKCAMEEGDAHQLGAVATILGSLPSSPPLDDDEHGYFVEWDDMPGVPVFVRGKKIRPLDDTKERTDA